MGQTTAENFAALNFFLQFLCSCLQPRGRASSREHRNLGLRERSAGLSCQYLIRRGWNQDLYLVFDNKTDKEKKNKPPQPSLIENLGVLYFFIQALVCIKIKQITSRIIQHLPSVKLHRTLTVHHQSTHASVSQWHFFSKYKRNTTQYNSALSGYKTAPSQKW